MNSDDEQPALARSFFDENSPYLAHPLLTDQRTSAEIDRLVELIGPFRGPILDLGCGFGRHVIELARRGLAVTGVDPSATMIAEAQRRASEEQLDVELVERAAEDFDGQGQFAEAICLFTSFGQRNPFEQLPSAQWAERFLAATKQSLKPDAPLVLEIPDFDRAVELLAVEEQLGPTHVRRRIDPSGLVSELFDGPAGEFHLSYQSFTPEKITLILEANGFRVESILDHGLVEPPGHLLTVVARNNV